MSELDGGVYAGRLLLVWVPPSKVAHFQDPKHLWGGVALCRSDIEGDVISPASAHAEGLRCCRSCLRDLTARRAMTDAVVELLGGWR